MCSVPVLIAYVHEANTIEDITDRKSKRLTSTMDIEDEIDLKEDFEYEISKRLIAWGEAGIDRRGIISGQDGYTVKNVTGWINTPGSRRKFDRVMDELGREFTVESVVASDRFLPLTSRFPSGLSKARGRLDGSVAD